jgi:hypothetical protein
MLSVLTRNLMRWIINIINVLLLLLLLLLHLLNISGSQTQGR